LEQGDLERQLQLGEQRREGEQLPDVEVDVGLLGFQLIGTRLDVLLVEALGQPDPFAVVSRRLTAGPSRWSRRTCSMVVRCRLRSSGVWRASGNA
jgi:hypothetical protein